MKLKDANIDWDSVINQAQDWASKLGDKINDPGFWEKLGNFFMDLWDKIKSLLARKVKENSNNKQNMNQTTPGNVSIKAALKGVFYIFDKKIINFCRIR